MKPRREVLERSVRVHACAASVWREVTEVDITSFRHPTYLALLGVPKPVRAKVVRAGVGGARIATFANGMRFSQEITDWQPGERYAFTFRPDPGFRVAYCLDLSDGPFRMTCGAYRIDPAHEGVRLSLASEYELHGILGTMLRWPVRLTLLLFQAYLLRGIKSNAERRERSATPHP
jgi:hypothetical protein